MTTHTEGYYVTCGPWIIAKAKFFHKEKEEIDRIYGKLEDEYYEVCDKYAALQVEHEHVAEELKRLNERLEYSREAGCYKLKEALEMPDISRIFWKCNNERWFKNYRMDETAGVIYLSHDRSFYPCDTIAIPLGAVRVLDIAGYPVNMTQNHAFRCLSQERMNLGKKLIPEGYTILKTRVLFGTRREEGFWLQNPRSAQDVMLEIKANGPYPNNYARAEAEAIRARLDQWSIDYDGVVCLAPDYMLRFDLIVSLERFLNSGDKEYAKSEIDDIREKCYTEYLDLYFNPGAR